MPNDARQAVTFHDATKYSRSATPSAGDERIGIGDPATRTEAIWQKDWDIKPFLYKVYETLPPIELTRDLPDTGRPALEAIAATGADARRRRRPGPGAAGRLGLLTNGSLDRTWTTRDGRVHHYRTAGGTGAQYHLELYFVCTDLADLDAGVYHYSAIDHSLRLLRSGRLPGRARRRDRERTVDRRRTRRPGHDEHVLAQRVALPRARLPAHVLGRRHVARPHPRAAASAHVATTLVFGYADPLVNALLGVDGMRESTVALVALGGTDAGPPHAPPIEPARPSHEAAVVGGGDVPRDHRHAPRLVPADRRGGRAVALARWHRPLRADRRADRAAPAARRPARSAPVEQIIFRRRSTRNYDTDVEIPFDAFSTLLERSTRGVASDVLTPGAPLTDLT